MIGAQESSKGREARKKERKDSEACQEETREFFGQTQALSLVSNGINSRALVLPFPNTSMMPIYLHVSLFMLSIFLPPPPNSYRGETKTSE
jgi:hypothetical protein